MKVLSAAVWTFTLLLGKERLVRMFDMAKYCHFTKENLTVSLIFLLSCHAKS
jgi:hypothetical protein